MPPNYMSMSGYGQGYQPLAPFALTQPQALPLTQPGGFPSWMPEPVAPVQRSFATAAAVAPAFNYETDMAGLMPTSTPLGGTDLSNAQILQSVNAPGSGSMWDRFFNTRDQQGWGGLALQGASSLANLYMGMKQYGLAKDQLNFQKDSFNKQYAANQQLTNSRLEDRQARRVLENPNATPVADYMSKWGVK
jgi:hypothetical protein